MGRSRKPFIEKSTNLFLKLENKKIVELLEILNIQYEQSELVFDTESLNKLSDEIKNILDEFIKKCKK